MRNFLISSVSSSQCWVYCHLAVFSLSTTWSKCKYFCSNSSICRWSLLKLKSITLLAKYCKKYCTNKLLFVYVPGQFYAINPSLTFWGSVSPQFILPLVFTSIHNCEAVLKWRINGLTFSFFFFRKNWNEIILPFFHCRVCFGLIFLLLCPDSKHVHKNILLRR